MLCCSCVAALSICHFIMQLDCHQKPDFCSHPSAYLGLKKGYLFMYNLVQFLGFSWIFVNMTVRLFILGQGLCAALLMTINVQ